MAQAARCGHVNPLSGAAPSPPKDCRARFLPRTYWLEYSGLVAR